MSSLSGRSSKTAIHMDGPTAAAARAEESSAIRQETAADAGERLSPQGPAAVSEAQRRVQLFLTALMSAESFDKHTLQGMQLVSCGPGRVSFTLLVEPQLQNRYGTLHGGAIATLVDVVGSLALITLASRSGVSLAINTSYLNPMPGGEVVCVDASVLKLGRDVGVIDVQLRRDSTGQLVAMGTHTKKLTSASDMSALFDSELQQQQQQQQQQVQAARSPARPHSRL